MKAINRITILQKSIKRATLKLINGVLRFFRLPGFFGDNLLDEFMLDNIKSSNQIINYFGYN